MSSVGSYLRELRERRGVSLGEIARSTRVAHRYLEALEADDFAALPAPVFTRGFIRAYCQMLGETPSEALARYDRRGGELREGDKAVAGAPASSGARVASAERAARGAVFVSFVLLVVLGVALFAVTLALQSGRDEPPDRRASLPIVEEAPARVPATTAPATSPAADQALAAPSPRPATAPATSPAAPPAPVAAATLPFRLVARTTEPTWIRVRTEDGHLSEETIPAGQVREWVSNRPFVVSVGNAGGVTLELNGRTLPPLGPSGAVIPRMILPSDAQ